MESECKIEPTKLKPITLEETCIVGSVNFTDYKTPGSEGNIRGGEAIESLCNIAKKGCKAVIIVGETTDNAFIEDLKKNLSSLGDKAENISWSTQKRPGYSQARREAVMLARSKYPDSRALIMQEIEKDLSPNYEDFIGELSKNNVLVMMNRGVNVPYNENPWPDADHIGANLPHEQFWKERHQNVEMANQENAAGLTIKERTWDRLNGTRVIRNEKIMVGNSEINPADLMLLEYRYLDGYQEEDRTNKIDSYSAAVYNLIPILEGLGLEDQISEVPVKYMHPEKQKEQEENNPTFRMKRIKHGVDLPSINFDIVANIDKWKRDGLWPQILIDAINGNKTLEIRHFDRNNYNLSFGEIKS